MRRQHRTEIIKILELSDPSIMAPVLEVVDDLIARKKDYLNQLNKRQRVNSRSLKNVKDYAAQRMFALQDAKEIYLYVNTISKSVSILKDRKYKDHLSYICHYSRPFDKDMIREDVIDAYNEM